MPTPPLPTACDGATAVLSPVRCDTVRGRAKPDTECPMNTHGPQPRGVARLQWEEADPHVPSGLRVPLKSCQLNETTYQHGEIFSAQELFPARLSNQCVLCSCIEGHTYCGLMTCPEPSCPTSLPLPDSCCQTCKDISWGVNRGGLEAPAGAQSYSPGSLGQEHSRQARWYNRTTESSTEENLTQLQHGEALPLDHERVTSEAVWSGETVEGRRHSQDPCSERRGPSTPAPTSLSSPLGFIPRHFQSIGMGGTTIKIILKEKHKKACTHNGKTYSHGEVWHPTVLSFGPMPCILCTCIDGYQDCHRVTCPTQYPCSQPKKVSGKCCKICPEDEADDDHSEVMSTRCPRVPGQFHVYTLASPSADSLHRFVLEHETSEQVDMYIWKPVRGIYHLVQIKRVRKQDFQKEAQNFRLLTGTHEGYWTVFLAQTPELKVTASPDKVTKTL
ncbi:Chordin-like protein 2 [Apodemus speciosus]|uniref:Chordin-like protein 2 n=1 Tax=Apodemus speciosus TaxID=105296 RepID=A0ABQ0EZZ4_APOSI